MAEKPTDRSAAVRSWLMKNPRPAKLQVYGRDGKEYDVEIRPGVAWSETAISVTALDPERLEAVNADGKLLRACVVANLVEKEEAAIAQQGAAFAAMQSTDPETQRLIAIATLLERAHERATDAIQQTVGIAFTQLQEICNSLATQATVAQATANELTLGIRNLLIQQAQDAADQIVHEAKPEAGPLERLAESFMAGQAMAGAEAAPTPKPAAKPNGKH